VLLVDDPDFAGRLRLHRLTAIRGGALILRGDANAQVDSTPVAPSAVHGQAFLRIPLVGYPLLWLRTGRLDLVAACCAGLLVLMLIASSGRLLTPAERSPGRRTTPGPRGHALR
jgi:signal peptidase